MAMQPNSTPVIAFTTIYGIYAAVIVFYREWWKVLSFVAFLYATLVATFSAANSHTFTVRRFAVRRQPLEACI